MRIWEAEGRAVPAVRVPQEPPQALDSHGIFIAADVRTHATSDGAHLPGNHAATGDARQKCKASVARFSIMLPKEGN